MPKSMKTFFLVHAIVALLFGLLLFIIPGRFLQAVDWSRIDPIAGRLLGAVLLGLTWGSFRLWRAKHLDDNPHPAILLAEIETLFTGLACVGLLRHLLFLENPPFVWVAFVVMAVFAAGWAFTWRYFTRELPGIKGTPPAI